MALSLEKNKPNHTQKEICEFWELGNLGIEN